MNTTKILCVTDYYLPGYKAGGPIRTIENLSEILAEDFNFSIVTRDRDLGDTAPYDGVQVDEWQTVGPSAVYYASPETFGAPAVERTFDKHCVLYLNSFFSFRGSIWPYLKFRKRAKILIAPRGEFSPGALAIRRPKKRAFITVAKLLRLYRDVQWHASTALEARDIEEVFPGAIGRIHLAIDPVVMGAPIRSDARHARSNALKIAFISRISPKKNVDGLLQILAVGTKQVELNIYGPVEDAEYWRRCQNQIARLPDNVRVNYMGALKASDVSAAFAEHDLFAFPTHGENFGHVIFEALRAGTPVLVSDQTPWTSDESGAVTVAPHNAIDQWRAQIERAADRTEQERRTLRAATLEYARQYARNAETRMDNIRMFHEVARR